MLITDNTIKEYFKGCKNNISISRKGQSIKDKDILNYLNNRYNDSTSIIESIYRILNNIEKHPLCPICGKLSKYMGSTYFLSTCGNKKCKIEYTKKIFMDHYGTDNPAKSEIVKEKIKNTNLKNCGYTCNFSSPENRIKQKNTCLKKYGDENYHNIEKAKLTNLKKYGNAYPTKCKEVLEKTKNTCKLKYNTDWPFQSKKVIEKWKENYINKTGYDNPLKNPEVKEKVKNTCIEKYNSLSWSSSKEGKEKLSYICSSKECLFKRSQTLKRNNSYNISKSENEVFEFLKNKYTDIIRQYRSDKYPFNCDFYIPSEDLYIEYQGTWTHGFHPFNPNDKNDTDKLELWKEKAKTSRYYKNCIYSWTDLDVRKRNIAKENKLNYLEFFSKEDLYNYF